MSNWDTETAEWYAEKYGEYATNKLGINALTLAADCTVIDIGCGTGSALRHASETVTHGALIGIDPVPRMIEIAIEKTVGHSAEKRISYYEGSAEKIPVQDGFADIVLAFDSYDHWHDSVKGLNEVRRVLKSGGVFVIVKDGGLPNEDSAKTNFLSALIDAGFTIIKETNYREEGVVFSQWLCTAEVECSGL